MTTASVLATSIVAVGAFAQNTPEVTVTSTRAVEKAAGRTASGIPIVDVSLTYGVSAAGLDLTSSSGRAELEKRVSDAALEACKELGKRYPGSQPTDTQCAKAATDKAMAQVHQMEDAATKK
ncbi:MAG TPA: UrcA family protein [Steroidobacteraceae bacterium]|nr:UrcA family protein [Steroidobacteraceae bacterium]